MILRDTNIRRALRDRQRGFLMNPFRFGGGAPAPSSTSLADWFTAAQRGFAYEFWNKATLFQDTAGTTAVTTSGQAIARANDISGNAHHLTQATASLRPAYTESGGLSWGDFAADYLSVAASTATLKWIHSATTFGFAALVRCGTAADPNAAYIIVGNSGATAISHGFSIFYDDRASVSYSNAFRADVSRGDGSGQFLFNWTLQNAITPNTDKIIYVNRLANSLDGYVENVFSVTDTPISGTPSTSNASYDLQVGASNGILPFVGRIYGLILREGSFSLAERDSLQAFFATKR